MSNKQITEEEKTKYRKGCLTALAVCIALIVLSAGIAQITSYRTNVKESAKYMAIYKENFPKESTEFNVLFHVSNNKFLTIKTNLSNTGEGVAKGQIIKDEVLEMLKENNLKGSGIKVISKENKTLYDSTTKSSY